PYAPAPTELSPLSLHDALPIYAASQAAEPRSFVDVPNLTTADLAFDLRWELERLRSVGIERVIAVDLTRSDFGIPVVRVVIPALDRKSTRLNSSHVAISYAVFC